MANQILSKVVESPNWDAVPRELKKRIYENVIARTHRLGAIAALPPEQRTGVLLEAVEGMMAKMGER